MKLGLMGLPSVPRVPENEGGRGRPFKTTHTISLFLPDNDKTLWEDFKAAMRRDGWTASEILREWMRQYLKDHPLGNPQTPLERYEDLSKPLPHKHLWHGHSDDFGSWFTCDVPGCNEKL
jgi:hypothetical protein